MSNKVKYNLKNVHYAPMIGGDVAADGTATYGESKPWNGAVSLSLEPQGSTNIFYADGIAYFTSDKNSGYQGDFESALIPQEFQVAILGLKEDTKGNLFESADGVPKHFAFFFQFDGDKRGTPYCLYNCTVARPTIAGQTSEDSIEPQTSTAQITATTVYIPGLGNVVKAQGGDNMSDADIAAFFASIPVKGDLIGVSISGDSKVAGEGTIALTATTVPASASVTWTTSDDTVATVEGGTVTGVAAGEAVITAKITYGGVEYTAQHKVTVTE